MLIKFINYKRLNSWKDDENRIWHRNIKRNKTIVLPPEYDFYLKRFGRVYKIERSRSGYSWNLTVDNNEWGWDQDGDFVQVLYRGVDWRKALDKAEQLLPEEAAFWIEDGFFKERLPIDDEFDKWYKNL